MAPAPEIVWPFPEGKNRIRRGLEAHTFGMVRTKIVDGKRVPKAHQGWDFAAPIGTPFRAIGTGTVEAVEERGAFGLCLLLKHDRPHAGTPIWSFYAHLQSVVVEVGDHVTAGTPLGLTGDSGNAQGLPGADEHLHLELRTEPWPGLGIYGRFSPLAYFGRIPLTEAI